jgi:hypothetical protein
MIRDLGSKPRSFANGPQKRKSKLLEKMLCYICLYGGGVKDTVESLRMRKNRNMVIKCLSNMQIQKLPPTPDAAKFHYFRVYY